VVHGPRQPGVDAECLFCRNVHRDGHVCQRQDSLTGEGSRRAFNSRYPHAALHGVNIAQGSRGVHQAVQDENGAKPRYRD
jgi:hypothetical protein